MEEILPVLKKFASELEPDRVTREKLGEGMRRYFTTLLLVKEIESKGAGPKKLSDLSEEELEVFTSNIRIFLHSVVEVLSTVPPNQREEGVALIFMVIYFIVDLGSLRRELYDQFLQSANFRTMMLKLHNEVPDASPDDTMAEISQLAVTILSLDEADQGMLKEMILILACTIKHLNKLSETGELTDFIIQDTAGFFMALTKADAAERLSSFLDMSFKLKTKEGFIRFMRLEFKAWVNKSFLFDASGKVPLIDDWILNDLVQAYRYIFESIFLFRDMRSLGYVIPENVGPKGVTPEMIRKVIKHLMTADATYLETLLRHKGTYRLRGPANPTKLEQQLAAKVLEKAEKDTNDFSFRSLMKYWDELLDEDRKDKNLYEGLEKFATSAKTVEQVHEEMTTELATHMDDVTNTVGAGVMTVPGKLGHE